MYFPLGQFGDLTKKVKCKESLFLNRNRKIIFTVLRNVMRVIELIKKEQKQSVELFCRFAEVLLVKKVCMKKKADI